MEVVWLKRKKTIYSSFVFAESRSFLLFDSIGENFKESDDAVRRETNVYALIKKATNLRYCLKSSSNNF